MKYLNSMANSIGVDSETFYEVSNDIGILKKDGTPKKQYVDAGYFNPNGTIADSRAVKDLYLEKLKDYLEK